MALGLLNIKSGYTFLKSSLKIKDIVKIGKDNNLPFLTLTDFNNMFGSAEFINECKDNNIKGVIGMEVNIDIYESKLILIASSTQGYLSLCKLTKYVSNSKLNSFATLENLEECKDGIIAIFPTLRNNFDELDYEKRDRIIRLLKNIYTSLYLGLEVYGDNDILKLDDIREYARNNLLSCVPCNEILTQSFETTYLLDILEAIDLNTSIEKIEIKNHTYKYVLSESKIKSIFSEQEINNANKIGNLVEYDFDSIKGDLVHYPLKDDIDSFEYLRSLAYKGLEKRLNNKVTKIYYDRLEYELGIIKKMNYVNYFLVVFDYVRYAKQNDILVGPGRGSAGASLVSYSLGIINVDPLKYNLLFERFLNPERISMPDIDVDFIDTKRDQVIDYLINKYGKDRTARVISFQTFQVKSSLRDVAKAYGFSKGEEDTLSDTVGDGNYNSLDELIKTNNRFLSMVKTNDSYKKVYQTALFIEGLPRQTSMHAAGIICNDKPLCNVIPVYDNDFGITLTQLDGGYIERFNLFKMDILSLANLSIIDNCVKEIKNRLNINIDLNNINLDDPNIYTLFDKGLYGGIFQMDENSIKNAARQIKPKCFMDIVVCLSIGRPGPEAFIPLYVDRKDGLKKIEYFHKSLEPILKETYGILVYQEQIMQILVKMAGFSLGKADLTRRAISKKNEEKLQAERNDFISGCIRNGYSKEDAINVFDIILKFASYGFNKSHSVAYAMISAQMCYLKYYYPQYFYCSLFNYSSKETKLEILFRELKINNIKILYPSINVANLQYTIDGKDIRCPLIKIKNINNNIASIIVKERNNGPYKSFIDFIRRVYAYGIKKEDLINLIKAGCFDEFNLNRITLLNNLDTCIMYASIVSHLENDKVVINNLVAEPNISVYEDNFNVNIENEKEVLGTSLSKNPLELVRDMFKDAGFITISEINEEGKKVKIVGKINRIYLKADKNNQEMAFIDVEDETGIISLIVYHDTYIQYKDFLNKDAYIQIKGESDFYRGNMELKAIYLKPYQMKVE